MRLAHTMIFVKDLPRMTAFYAETLGLKPVEATRLENYVEFEAGPVTFALHAIPAQIAEQVVIATPPQPREQNPMKLTFEVDDLATERTRLEALGVTILDRPWGSWDAVDPEGNVFGVCSSAK
ncbi:MAG: VOC family protein [Acidobacteriota bacterium]